MIIQEVIALLEQEYGLLKWNPEKQHLDVLIKTILSQNTSDLNSGRAFKSLISTFDSWQDVASADIEHIAQSIKCGGLSKIKAIRIKQILNTIWEEHGSLTLDFLETMNTTEVRNFLMSLPGVGLKTASCVILFSMGRQLLPVDRHIFRVSKRLGLLGSNVSIEEAHNLLQNQVPPSKIYQFHVHLIKHGRQVCQARQPRCRKCVFEKSCPSSTTPITNASS
jgi:endonuclease III